MDEEITWIITDCTDLRWHFLSPILFVDKKLPCSLIGVNQNSGSESKYSIWQIYVLVLGRFVFMGPPDENRGLRWESWCRWSWGSSGPARFVCWFRRHDTQRLRTVFVPLTQIFSLLFLSDLFIIHTQTHRQILRVVFVSPILCKFLG